MDAPDLDLESPANVRDAFPVGPEVPKRVRTPRLVRSSVDALEHRRVGGRNLLVLRKRVAGGV